MGKTTTTTAAPTKYIDMLKQSQTEKEAQELEFANQEGKLQLQADILETEKKLSRLNRELVKTKGATTFNTQAIITKQVEIEKTSEALERMNALLAEMF